jgi:hypothetical protein
MFFELQATSAISNIYHITHRLKHFLTVPDLNTGMIKSKEDNSRLLPKKYNIELTDYYQPGIFEWIVLGI